MTSATRESSRVVGSAQNRVHEEVVRAMRTSSLKLALESGWSTSPVIWAMTLPFLVFGSLLRSKDFYPSRTGALILVIGVSQLIVLAMLLLVRSQRRPGRPLESMSPVQVVVLWIGCGVTLSLVLHVGIESFVNSTNAPGIGLATRLLNLTAATVVCYLAFTYLADGVVRTQVEVRRLRRVNERILSSKRQSEGFVEAQSRLLAENLNTQVIPDLELLAEQAEALAAVAPTEELEALQSRVAYYSETIVRAMSRDISKVELSRMSDDREDEAPPGLSLRVLARMVMHSPVRLVPTAILLFVIVIQQMVPSCLSRAGLMWASVISAVVIGNLVAWGWSSAARREAFGRAGDLTGVGIALQYLLMIAALVWAAKTPRVACEWQGGLPELVIVIVIGLTGIMALSVALETSRSSAAQAVVLESRIRESEALAAELDRAGIRIRDQIAVTLHGSVQGRLTAIALAIVVYIEAVGRGASPDHRQLLQRVTELLDLALSDVRAIFGEEQAPVSIETMLEALQGQWTGLIDVTWGMSPRAAELLGADPDLADWTHEIVGEAVTNASRHGQARSIQIRLDADRETGTRITVTATDNGVGPPSAHRAGLGSSRVQSRGGSWTLEPGPYGSGSVMTVVLPTGQVECAKTDDFAGGGAWGGRM